MAEVLEGVIVGAGGFERRVAIKRILREHSSDASFSRMFLDEARIASRLHHSNVVAILDFGIADGVPFQVLELVEGIDAHTLRKALKSADRPMSVEVALHVCVEIAHALAYAHGATGDDGKALGIVHRDVSPHNILVSWNGDVKLTDFGIALAKDRSEKTETGIAKGKLNYMAPEQMLAGTLDGRVDLFALGCTLHTLVTGASPLAAEERLSELLTGVPLPLDPALPEDVRAIVERAVRRSKVERYPSASAMADALSEALAARDVRDGRRLLREWIAGVRPLLPAPETGVPVQIDLVLENAAERTFRAASEAAPTVPIGQPVPPAHVQRRRRRIALAAASPLAIAALLFTVWKWSDTASVIATPAPGSPATPLALASPSAQPSATEPPPSATLATTPPVRPSPKTTATRVAAVATPAGTGILAIGGAGAQRAEILVDGKSAGFAPKLLELPAGRHEVVLVTPSGARLGPHRVELKAQHTRSAPLRWTVD